MKKVIFLFSMVWSLGLQGQDSLYSPLNDALEYKIDSIVQMGIQQKAYPGAQVLIFKHDSIRFNKSYTPFVRAISSKQNFGQHPGLYEIVRAVRHRFGS